ncbi:serine/threonine protein phosphatase [Phragmitibacter flavus]|uniref:Serine/threonine protein phosphatase n=1 Tax=Phragmitibacter flavus TaxID=2576071 RepID=A0A5R8KHV7_9BACT|nr:metallophosphoesterase family protein [Phragmitibacter flavus]TLD71904.1 serine/threonine protein phosphatase [Phragmitibacter flavus]
MNRTFAIGDIHGCLTALQILDEHLQFGPGDLVITLGDYVDRGADSAGVVDYLLALATRTQLIPLRGNHEVMMLDSRHDPHTLQLWIANGGDATLASYTAPPLSCISESHWSFLNATLPYHELQSDFFVHANVNPELPLDQQTEESLYWQHLGKQLPHVSGRRMICGHTSQKSGEVLNLGHTVCIDTWACGNGWLTALEVSSNDYWQANQKGQLRQSRLS